MPGSVERKRRPTLVRSSKFTSGRAIPDPGNGGRGENQMVESTMSNAATAVRSDMSKAKNAASDAAEDTYASLSDAAEDAYDKAKGVATDALDWGKALASDAAAAAGEAGDAATHQVRTFVAEVDGMVRRNPLGTMAGAVIVGVLIGMMVRPRA